MRRRIAIISVFLVLGAIVNVAVAWGIGVRAFVEGNPVPTRANDVNWWRAHAPPAYPDAPDAHMLRHVSVGTTYERLFHSIDMGSSPFMSDNVWRWRVGVPLRSMETSVWRGENLIERRQDTMSLHDPIFASLWSVPTRPVWAGFVMNSVFYGVITSLSFGGLVAIRRKRRRKRGQCEKCAYPIGVSAVCTECGAAVRCDTVGGTHSRAPGT